MSTDRTGAPRPAGSLRHRRRPHRAGDAAACRSTSRRRSPRTRRCTSIGERVPRLDAVQKVTGRARYTFDVQLPGMLYARRVVSTVPHARISQSTRRTRSGIPACAPCTCSTGSCRPRSSAIQPSKKPRYPIVRYLGQPIAGVAATSQRAADAAAALVKVNYDVLPHVSDARRRHAGRTRPRCFPDRPSNPRRPAAAARRRAPAERQRARPGHRAGFRPAARRRETGLADADVVVDAEYRTQVQTHVPMETHGLVADWTDDGLTIYASTQFTSSVRDEAAELFRPSEEPGARDQRLHRRRIRREVWHRQLRRARDQPVAQGRRACRLMLDRREEHVSAGNRPDSLQRLKIGAKRDGTLTAIALESYGTGGVAGGAGVGFAHAMMYPCPNVRAEQYDVFTNAGPARHSARRVRSRASSRSSSRSTSSPTGWNGSAGAARQSSTQAGSTTRRRASVERRIGAEKFGWAARRASGLPIPDRSSAASASRSRSGCRSSIRRPSARSESQTTARSRPSARRRTSAPAPARSWHRSWPKSSASRADQIGSYIGDTRYPTGPASGGSRVTGSFTPAARNAAYKLARDLAARLAPHLGVAAGGVLFADGHVGVPGNSRTWLPFADAVKKVGDHGDLRIVPCAGTTTKAT